jgi:hypothetical protein
LAAEVGRSLSLAPVADPVQAVSEAIGGHFPQRRLLNSAVLDAAVVVEDELVALARTADLKNSG